MGVVLALRGGGGLSIPSSASPSDVISLLHRERASQDTWVDVAKAFLLHGNTDVYQAVLQGLVAQATGSAPEPVTFPVLQAHCALAAWHSHRGRNNRSIARAAFDEASTLLLNARNRALDDALPLLCMGQLALDKDNNRVAARQQFVQASKHLLGGRPTIAPTLALAALEFGEGNYKEALDRYKEALRRHPGCPAEVRLGLAACLFRLGDVVQAGAAYQRALDLDPSCTQALLGLAVLKLSASQTSEDMRDGSRLLVRAFEQDPENPYTLVLLAYFSLQQGFVDGAAKLAKAALDASDSEPLRLECTTVLARALHAQGRNGEAFRLYSQAATLDPRAPLPALGLGQLSLLRGELTNAASVLEGALTVVPAWTDALQVLGKLYPRLRLGPDAAGIPHFKAALKRLGERADLWEMLGDVLAPLDPGGALAAYQHAVALWGPANAGDAVQAGADRAPSATPSSPSPHPAPSARLLNNTAVLQLRAGQAPRAAASMEAALAAAAEGRLDGLGAEARVTLGFNAARVREAGGELSAAAREYEALLAQFPRYADPYLRLAAMAAARGDAAAAEAWARRASAACEGEAGGRDAQAFLASLYLERRAYAEAKEALDALLAGGEGEGGGGRPSGGGAVAARAEAFGRVALGNLNLYTAPRERKTPRDVERAEVHFSYAAREYARALERDPANLWAAQGLGCVLAEAGHLREARVAFTAVNEAAAASGGFVAAPDAGVNLAHVALAEEAYDAAVAGYGAALRRRGGRRDADPRLLLCLARAQHDANRLPEARAALVRAAHADPTLTPAWFDLGLALQEHAVRSVNARRAPGDPGRLAEFEAARRALETAHRVFEALRRRGARATGLKDAALAAHVEFVARTHARTRQAVESARREAELADARREERRAALEAARGAKALEDEEARLRAEAEARALEARAREHAVRLDRLKREWKDAAVVAKAVAAGDVTGVPAASAGGTGRGPSAADAAADALFYVEDEEGDEDFDPSRPEVGSGGEDGEEAPGTAALAAAGLLSSDEEEYAAGPGSEEEEAAEGQRPRKRKSSSAKASDQAGTRKKKAKLLRKGRRGGNGAADERAGDMGAEGDAMGAAHDGVEARDEDGADARDSGLITTDADVPGTAEGRTAAEAMADLFGSDSDGGSFAPGASDDDEDQEELEEAAEGGAGEESDGGVEGVEQGTDAAAAPGSGGKRGRHVVLDDSDSDG
uniref:Uncharacterized protein n=2 Tax=Auxenochlorella protothecoides TaxID=3075 RepID=A0A1D1ZQJ7_AUXPR